VNPIFPGIFRGRLDYLKESELSFHNRAAFGTELFESNQFSKMYKDGKLTDSARSRLEKRYAKERAKDSILAKIDAQTKRRPKKKQVKTQNKLVQPKEVEVKMEKKPVEVTREVAAPEESFEAESECPSTPPRANMVNERRAIMDQNAGVNWISFVEHVQAEAEAENELYQTLEHKSHQAFQTSLKEQVRLREAVREKERQRILKEQEAEQALYKKYDEEEAKKAAIRQAKVEELKKMRTEQINLLNQARRRYAKKEHRRELRDCARAQAEKEAHDRKFLDKKKAHYALMEKVLKENAEHKIVVEKQLQAEAAEDIRLQKMYAKMLEDQERAREERLAKTYAQAEKKVANLLDCTAAERKKQEEADARCAKELERRQAQEDERQRLKEERRRKANLETQDFLLAQIRVRKEALRKEKEEDLRLGQRLAEEAKQSLKKEEEKISRRRECLLGTSQFVLQQIKDNEERRIRERADMNENETKFNSSLIKQIEAGDLNVKEPEADPMRPFAWRYNYRSKPF